MYVVVSVASLFLHMCHGLQPTVTVDIYFGCSLIVTLLFKQYIIMGIEMEL